MIKLLVFGASNSRKSINKEFAIWAASKYKDATLNIIDLNDFEMPIFGVDRLEKDGIPSQAFQFIESIAQSDAIIVSLAEHNGSYTTAFKNIIDWASRVKKEVWQNKPMLLLSTSPGPRGGKTVLETAKTSFPFWDGKLVASFSLPLFSINFDQSKGIITESLSKEFDLALSKFKAEVPNS